jgi:hypothetical protein
MTEISQPKWIVGPNGEWVYDPNWVREWDRISKQPVPTTKPPQNNAN